jgi:hypothetical protein
MIRPKIMSQKPPKGSVIIVGKTLANLMAKERAFDWLWNRFLTEEQRKAAAAAYGQEITKTLPV